MFRRIPTMIERMTITDVEELLRLRKWTKRLLAQKLMLSEDSVYRWFHDSKVPGGPALVLMRHWLTEARKGESMPTAG